MAHRQAKKRAFELFQQGWFPPDVSGALNIGIRSCQRWFHEFKSQQNHHDVVSSGNVDEIVAVSSQEKSNQEEPIDDTRNHTLWIPKKWLQTANDLTMDHYRAHLEVREKIEKILNEKLAEPDLNLRAIHTLSLALARHTEAERTAVGLHLIDVNRAAQVVESHGLVITDPVPHSYDDE